MDYAPRQIITQTCQSIMQSDISKTHSIKNKLQLTLFFDGTCPLCAKEMDHLNKKNNGSLGFVDITLPNALKDYPQINFTRAMAILHGLNSNNELLLGLDANCKAWDLLGYGWRVNWLRWPIVRSMSDWGYLIFARNRYKISGWLTGQKRCSTCFVTPKNEDKAAS